MLNRRVDAKYIGIIYIILSAFFFALMNFFVQLSGDLPVPQKVFFRNLVATFFSLAMLLRDRSGFATGKGHVFDLFVRAAVGTLGVFGNFYALTNGVSVGDASMLNKLSPFFAIIFSFFLLKEKPKIFEWLAVIVAFVGAAFVVKPTFSAEVIPFLAGFLGGLCAGLAYAFVRKMGKAGVNGNLVIFVFSSFSCLVTAPFLIFDYHPMQLWQLFSLLAAGVAATGGQAFITKAYMKAPAKQISVYDYSIVLFASLLGFFFLGQTPAWNSYVGYAVIFLAAIGNWYFHLREDKKAKNTPPMPESNEENE